jgi:Crossover junction endodeoxyribonuclease RuvC
MGARFTQARIDELQRAVAKTQGKPVDRSSAGVAQAADTLIRETPVRKVLSIDPALRNTGWAVIERDAGGRQCRAVAYGVIRNKPKVSQSQ